ncbi:MAG: major facilitator transporter [Peptococcaceae bacterium BICA1-7]|nr:MAG: major facilitator transporter [Peptococcaceae bacterium BICA1-7]HBV97241.1 MFS transporter [Desulfotomaculum sp.]
MNDRPFPWVGILVLVLGAFMAILDTSIVNVALPKLMAIFGVAADQIQWVMTAYMLTSGVVVPFTGYLGDKYGYKRVYIYSLVAFTLGSALCGLAWNNNSLIAFRVIQAIGGGMLIPLSMSIIFKMVPRQKIGMAMGVWGIAAIMAPAVGPTAGGYLVDYYSWHLIFTINIPIGFLAFILTYMFIEETPLIKGLKFDYLGSILSCAGLFFLLLALSQGQDKGWASQYIVTLLTLSGFLLILFCLWELQVPHPMLDIRLFKNGVFAVSTAVTSVLTVAMFAVIFLVPLYCQNLQGLTPMQTGLLMMPMALATGFTMLISGRLFDKIGALPLGVVGIIITAYFTYKLSFISLDTSFRQLQLLLVYRAVGLGLCMMPIGNAGMNTIPPFLVGRASAINNLFRSVFASLGIAMITYIMLNRQAQHAVWLSDGISLSSPASVEAYNSISAAAGSLAGQGLGSPIAAGYIGGLVQKQAMVNGISDTLLFSTLLTICTLPFMWSLGKKKVEETRLKEKERYAHLAPPGFGQGPEQGSKPGPDQASDPGSRPGGPSSAVVME